MHKRREISGRIIAFHLLTKDLVKKMAAGFTFQNRHNNPPLSVKPFSKRFRMQ